MESKIQIDVDTSGQPQIRIDYRLTDDLRDKLIGRFLNWLGLPKDKGFWAYVRLGHEYQSRQDGPFDGAVAYIEPLDRRMLSAHMPEMQHALKDQNFKTDAPRSSESPTSKTVGIKFAILNHVNGQPRYYRGDGKWTPEHAEIPKDFIYDYEMARIICDFMSKDDKAIYAFGPIPERTPTLGEELNSALQQD